MSKDSNKVKRSYALNRETIRKIEEMKLYNFPDMDREDIIDMITNKFYDELYKTEQDQQQPDKLEIFLNDLSQLINKYKIQGGK